ncbi:MAG TPA: TIGR03564 family F420-dependent LLM class oxidoreductase [Candidatus Binatia bacterium]|nr:TIGR03564 family F420-dependent LLM class oxidoreductase [Candidatus Binatia bacterium]
MRIGWNGGGHHTSLDAIREQATCAVEDGFASFWLSQITGPDALTALAAIAANTPRIELGTSIVPVYGRHPLALAAQALTAQAACGGRLVLGIGASHQMVVEGMFGESYARSFTRVKETLLALKALLAGEAVSLDGKEIVARGRLTIEAASCPILLAALGEKMLDLAGREADGVTLWMVGPRTVAEYVAPRVTDAAARAARPSPRILAGVPVCVTDAPDRARAFAAEQLNLYGLLPAYRATLAREGLMGPDGLLAVGSEDDVREQLSAFEAAGATDLRVNTLCPTPDEAERTRTFLRALSREKNRT